MYAFIAYYAGESMIITCPVCFSRYSVQQESLQNGKLVRCAVCGSTWQQQPVSSDEPKRNVRFIIKWVCFWSSVFVSLFLLFFAKNSLIHIWPSISGFYKLIGLGAELNKNSFLLKNISNFFVSKNGKLHMGLRGEIMNISDEVKELPSITITLRDDLTTVSNPSPYKKVWVHELIKKRFLPNQKIFFETELQEVSNNNLICDVKLDI